MTPTAAAKTRWRPGKFLTAIVGVFLAQAGLVFWLGTRSVPVPRTPVPAPAFTLGDSRPDALARLEDPTLFVLPHQEGFSGQGWMRTPKLEFQTAAWSEPLRWLTASAETLGGEFKSYMQHYPALPFETILAPVGRLFFPPLPFQPPVSRPSALRIEGELARRRLLHPVELRSWPGRDPLTNTIVQVVVDPSGTPFSARLAAGSGSAEADAQALGIAENLQFDSIDPAGPGRASQARPRMMLGTLVFEWQTVPPTNGPAILP